MEFTNRFLDCCATVLTALDRNALEQMASVLARLRERGGRLFVLGVGGGAGHASHAVNDFRKLAGIEAYAPTDNVSEITARTNDEGWATVFVHWLEVSRLCERDAVLVFSVGGGNLEANVSPNLVHALQLAQQRKATILAVVGRDGGYAAEVASALVLIPNPDPRLTTPLTESFQALVWHLLVSHPQVARQPGKWESLSH